MTKSQKLLQETVTNKLKGKFQSNFMDNSEKLPDVENLNKKNIKEGYMPEKFYKQLNAVKASTIHSSNNSSKAVYFNYILDYKVKF